MRLSYLQSHYEINEVENGYSFVTDNGVQYILTFLEYPPVDDYLATKIYMFNIERGNRNGGQNDEKVCYTIVYVLDLFFNRNNDALITLTDMSDNKQDARRRLFNLWFDKFNAGRLTKLEDEVTIDELKFYVSLLFVADHFNADNLRNSFELLKANKFYFE